MPVSIEFLSGLYNRQSCYADRLTDDEIEAIHVSTELEDQLRKWIRGKKDIVLVGNPGDGKTHLLRRLQSDIERVRAEVVFDATAERDYRRLVARWKKAAEAKRPFCLAINQGPLNALLTDASSGFARLDELSHQLDSLLYYEAAPPEPKRVIVVDLNRRSILTREIIHKCLQNLLDSDALDGCPAVFGDEASDAYLNRRALSNDRVQARIVGLLTAASFSGRHISMRDLQGFLSYLLFGGRTVAEMTREPTELNYRYFNLCFTGEGDLFDVVREAFEPERVTMPEVDEHLWENTGVREGWAFERPPLTPDHLPDAWEMFTSLKRQYYFEHEDGEKLLGGVQNDTTDFIEMTSGVAGTDRQLPKVLRAINAFYCPKIEDDIGGLRLWGTQQYDGQAPRVLVSCHQVPIGRFELLRPRIAPWLSGAIAYRPDHLLLRYRAPSGQTIGLRIDRGLWRALSLASRGLPMGLRSPQHSQALQTFTARLRRAEAAVSNFENLVIYSVGGNRTARVSVDRAMGAYTQP